ncbi:MAG: DJ-1/PfpI family protein [Myxococcales bacterium]|nr:DJ-1/PfpI family protein [Myxococcales bacterium]MCB9576813.1 DJ-1/PfpI family protein [Polyangiaceae bacterium]
MAKVVVVLQDGFEEIEAVTVIDVLRRADVNVVVARAASEPALGSHGIRIATDANLDGVSATDFDAVVLPGGMPGAANLRDDARVRVLLREAHDAGKLVAAICAGPIALEAAGVLEGKRATCYPGFELPSATQVEEPVVIDGNVITSRGVGSALSFALALVSRLAGPAKAADLAERMLVSA